MMEKKEELFLKSVLTKEGFFMSSEEVVAWLQEQNKKIEVQINRIAFHDLKLWHADKSAIMHDSGRFFSITGIHVNTNWGGISQWEQPIINQPEVGFLGFITKEFNGVLHFLMQAKIEPGNINYVQLSPTLQATKSNYSKVHKGSAPLYLEYFQHAQPKQILLDQLQSEQGARFLKKRNRNIIIKIDEDIPLFDNFIWLTLGQIKTLINIDNLINMDTRTVISGIPYGEFSEHGLKQLISTITLELTQQELLKSALISGTQGIHSIDNIISFITKQKSSYDLDVNRIPLGEVKDWIYGDYEIYHKQEKYFKVIAVDVQISNREVVRWTQPMVEPVQEGLCAFVCKEINGILHFAVQAKLECGNFDIIELAPTVQCLTGNYRDSDTLTPDFLNYVLETPRTHVIYDSYQSEEGGRFYREQNRNMIVLADPKFPVNLPDNFIWMTLQQMYTFLRFNNYLNIQARSLIAAISFV